MEYLIQEVSKYSTDPKVYESVGEAATTTSVEAPGFGVVLGVAALLGSAVLMARRKNRNQSKDSDSDGAYVGSPTGSLDPDVGELQMQYVDSALEE